MHNADSCLSNKSFLNTYGEVSDIVLWINYTIFGVERRSFDFFVNSSNYFSRNWRPPSSYNR